ncbi:MAG: ABC transporter ATP-binding protein [Pseudonocardia sp.]|nr:ABC transporter ATP-binding protein [Pseudonocardia sp.]
MSLEVAPGEFVAIVGPSGCGKSTLLAVLAGLEAPDAGRVLVDGHEAAAATGSGTGPFAYMPQQDLLFPWRTVLDNTALGLEVAGMPRGQARRRAGELFGPFGLAGFERARPDELSGGMRQRAALLRTVVQDRPVLLLDEPFGALDSLTRADMQAWLDGVRATIDRSIVMITHDLREAVYLADRVIVLGRRPARVMREIVVDLPRPRDPAMVTTLPFGRLEEQVLAALRGA